jgi:hypothetical protein
LYTSKPLDVILSHKTFAPLWRKALQKRNVLLFIYGFLLASLFYFYVEDSYEKQLFEGLADYVKGKSAETGNNEETLILQSLHLTNYLGRSRSFIYSHSELNTVKSSLIHPVTVDLQTAKGACGSYSYILSRLLNELKIPNRIAQMKVDGLYGGHILVEAKTSKGWVVIDGLYDLSFKKPDGALASFADVQGNWDYYQKQVPQGYDYAYRFEGVRYTNWNKIPIMLPFMKSVFSLFWGKDVDTFSLRTYFVRKFHVLFVGTVLIYSILLFVAMYKYARKRKYMANSLYINNAPHTTISRSERTRA